MANSRPTCSSPPAPRRPFSKGRTNQCRLRVSQPHCCPSSPSFLSCEPGRVRWPPLYLTLALALSPCQTRRPDTPHSLVQLIPLAILATSKTSLDASHSDFGMLCCCP
ncbi:uncharacterized protein BDZ99DRAFT_144183 [Mytilinidion resinicola]|uniref:Uncharacterized protein n=1 Tax=Mytilinidion resinicola TaxID=574789 RepID=A0A6A6YA23_9PEZI|nr:uncharacterized protein BDZ99DRAFT_144183 [Mytilinidion resinicola]KAF2804844.1 hypothetical protein BDZ99DRAFT_144183 [Mytilinidion resinicola]